MSVGRRKIRLEDESAWIFNRMVEAYEARPAYPPALVDAIAKLARSSGASVGDIGAGLGHLALPLAERGLRVTALEPALRMLERLQQLAAERALALTPVHGMAEDIPLPNACFELVVISDAIHFLDSELAAYEVKRVLAPQSALALVTCELTPTPFMQAVMDAVQQHAARRPRQVASTLAQMLAVCEVRAPQVVRFQDETAVDVDTVEQILCSISFVGPAFNSKRRAALRDRLRAIDHPPRWARTFTVRHGVCSKSARGFR